MFRHRIASIRRLLARLAASSAGNVTIIFSLTLVVIISGAGAAIDYVRMLDQRTAFNAAADAAVLAAVSSARKAEQEGEPNIKQIAEDAAFQSWAANIHGMRLDFKNEPEIKVQKSGLSWTATLSFKEESPTAFMSVIGIRAMPLKGVATASMSIEKIVNYWDFHIVIDTSSSMGIGATTADMDEMQANPNINCTFACHWADYSKGETDTVSIAAKAGIKLRVDVVDEAVDSMVGDMITASTANNVRAKLWGLNDTVQSLVDITTKLNDIKNHKIELYRTPVSVGNTNYMASMSKLLSEVGKAGSGKSAVDQKKAVFIITDGIHDTNTHTSNVSYVWWDDHQMGTIDPASCQAFKDNGVLVGVLFIDYISPPVYADVMSNVTPDVLPALKACASDGLFYNATSPDGIKAAMKDMLSTAFGMGSVRLTN